MILFGTEHVYNNAFFTLKNQPHLRGHKYVIAKQGRVNRIRQFLPNNRAVNLWNNYQFVQTLQVSVNLVDH